MQINEGGYIDTHFREPLVEENTFSEMLPDDALPPTFDDSWKLLPRPFWEGHEDAMDCYRRVWELAFANLRRPEPGSGFVASFIDTAFNDCLFMWDSAFILLFARYGRRAFDFQRKLQLPRHFFAVLYIDELLTLRIPRQIDRDAQQAPGGALDVHQFVTQPGHGLRDDVLQCHFYTVSLESDRPSRRCACANYCPRACYATGKKNGR